MSDQGTAYIANESAGAPPVDTKTTGLSATYQGQIDAIKHEIEEIETANFYWCAKYGVAHKCDYPKNTRFVNRKVKGDREAEERIAVLKNELTDTRTQMKNQLEQATQQFSNTLNDFTENKAVLAASLEGKVLFSEGISWLCMSYLNHFYFIIAGRGRKEEDNPDGSPTPSGSGKGRKSNHEGGTSTSKVKPNGTVVNGNAIGNKLENEPTVSNEEDTITESVSANTDSVNQGLADNDNGTINEENGAVTETITACTDSVR